MDDQSLDGCSAWRPKSPCPPAGDGFSTSAVRRYTIDAEFASGGIATLHLGRLLGPAGFARTVAIKRLRPQYAKDAEFVSMFVDEARLTARIRHPNVVPTLDVVTADGELLVVMEYVKGESLAVLLRTLRGRDERAPLPVVAAILTGVLHGLHAAHEARDENGEPLGIIHRDVSPHNILVGTDGVAQLIDFGVARARGRAQITAVGEIKGKLGYMPAEQLFNAPLDRRADIFAASVVLWEALAGRRLFERHGDAQPFARFFPREAILPPSQYRSDVPTTLDAIVLRGLAHTSAGRPATAREMALALEAVVTPATPSQVGLWVASLASEGLVERAQLVAAMECRIPGTGAPAAEGKRERAPSIPEADPSEIAQSATLEPPLRLPFHRRPRWPVLAAVVAAALVALGMRQRAQRPSELVPSRIEPAPPERLLESASRVPPPSAEVPASATPPAAVPRPGKPRRPPKAPDRDSVL